ncbi:MAG: peptidoglycan synthetase [Bacteroidetes bacterium]|nr:MAG: peptidoglycan synthetase [Bacteroidota bacterium]TAG89011.1 MAG: peptidoglycan synthetase [Bacteroidota bacterium]
MQSSKKHIHFIAVGGSIMHNLALDAQKKGYFVTGSDDEIFEPSRSRLAQAGILPEKLEWNTDIITPETEMVIVGMHTHADNPELAKAEKLGLKIYSYPQYIREHSKNKKRIVIGGSHGKSSVTSMIMHVLKACNYDFDYLVGAKVEGFSETIKLTEEAKIIVIEGDEYASAPFDKTPKFLAYQANIAVITGVAWDHINIYPTYQDYINAFQKFVENLPKDGTLIYCQSDKEVQEVANFASQHINAIPYQAHKHEILNGITYLIGQGKEKFALKIFGDHNLQNIAAAKNVCTQIGIKEKDFLNAISSFKGAGKRLERVIETEDFILFKDYAHAPSKVSATTKAVKAQFEDRKLVACLELHTYSSLNKEFLPLYKNSLNHADIAFVYFNPKALALKRMPDLDKTSVQKAFGNDKIIIFDDINALKKQLKNLDFENSNLLMMSSGTFDGLDFEELLA